MAPFYRVRPYRAPVQRKAPWIAVAVMGVLCVVLLVVLLLRDDGVDVETLLQEAPAAAEDEGSARLVMSVSAGSEGGAAIDITGEGGVDFERGSGWFDLQLLGQELETRNDATTLYVRRAGDDAWSAATGDVAGTGLDALGTGPGQARALVELLGGEVADVEDLGADEIDGGSTRHVRVTVDAADADAQLEALAGADGELELEVWIDEHGLPVRLLLEGEVQSIPLVVTVDLTDWGAPLDVAIPPEGEIVPVSPDELAQLFGGATP
jgi:hypothetical protein